MMNRYSPRAFCVISCFILFLFVSSSLSVSQEKTDTAKLYAEIAGDYEFEMEGQVTTLSFYVKDGVLMGRAAGESDEEEVTLEPVEGKTMGFTTTNAQGMFIELTFSRDESGKITKCQVNAMGMIIEGIKIEKEYDDE